MAVGALAAYGLLGNWGSLDYTRWGGLPNVLGFALLLVFLLIFFAPGFGTYRILAGGVVLGSIPLAHNHVALTAGLLPAAYAGFLALSSRSSTRSHSRGECLSDSCFAAWSRWRRRDSTSFHWPRGWDTSVLWYRELVYQTKYYN
jgi:hypothetical protein